MKKFSLVLLVTVLTFMLAGMASANSVSPLPKYSEVPTEGRPAKNPNVGYGYLAEESNSSTASTYLIATVTSKISKDSPTQVTGSASTRAIYLVDEVSYDMVFQAWDGYSWVYFASIGKMAYNNIQVSGAHICSVKSGQYYRVKVTHKVKNGSDTSETISYSDYIYVD